MRAAEQDRPDIAAEPVRLEASPPDFEPPSRPVLKETGLAFIEARNARYRRSGLLFRPARTPKQHRAMTA
jgi:hypothetical protein